MAASRPGNPDRGWNDPPMFKYNTDGQRLQSSTRKNPLTQRVHVGMPQSYTSQATAGNKPSIPKSVTPRQPPVGAVPPLPELTPQPTAASLTTSPERSSGVTDDDRASEMPDDICETSLMKVRGVLKQCEEKLKARVADDIKKRLDVLTAAWKTDKLSAAVQQRMGKLSTALAEREYDKAHDIHLSLMVDHVSEVSQWMVGIKRLIMEARTALPYPPPPPSDAKDEGETQQIIANNPETSGCESKQQEDSKESAGDRTKESREALNGCLPAADSAATAQDEDNPGTASGETRADETAGLESHDGQNSEQTAQEIGDQPSDSLPPSAKKDGEEDGKPAESGTAQGGMGDCVKRTPAGSAQTEASGEIGVTQDSEGVTNDEPQ